MVIDGIGYETSNTSYDVCLDRNNICHISITSVMNPFTLGLLKGDLIKNNIKSYDVVTTK